MFCFPEGINIREEKDTPKKFNFVLTDEVGERTFASVLIFWEKLNDDIRKSIIPIYNEQIEKTQEEIIILQKLYVFYQDFLFFLIISYF